MPVITVDMSDKIIRGLRLVWEIKSDLQGESLIDAVLHAIVDAIADGRPTITITTKGENSENQ